MTESQPQFISPPNTLCKAKMDNGKAKLDSALLAKADAAVDRMQQNYTDWADEDLTMLEKTLAEIRGAEDQAPYIKILFRHALDMKGEGGSFGYDKVTQAGGSLADFLADKTTLKGLEFDVVAAHVQTMPTVFARQVKGGGGTTGQALLGGLNTMVAKAASGAQGRSARW
jgi:chemotaxis protein histidine kinase CheA